MERDHKVNRKYEKGLVNVLVPCYNGEAYINRFFRSFEKQTYRPIELILVNDGSTDESDALIRKEIETLSPTGIRVNYIVQENRGLGGAINRAIKEIRGEYFVWFNIDDILYKDCIEIMVDFLNKHQEYALVRPDVHIVDETDTNIVLRKINDTNQDKNNPHLFENAITGNNFTFGCSMLRTEAFDKTNKSREIYESRQGQNWQLLLPVLYKYKSGYIDIPLYKVVEQSESTSRVHTYEKRLLQLKEYEKILLTTLAGIDMSESEAREAEIKVKKRYAHILFRESTNNGDYITAKIQYNRLRKMKAVKKEEKSKYRKRFFTIEYWMQIKKSLTNS